MRAWGGGEKWIYGITNLLDEKNIKTKVIALNYSPEGINRISKEQLLNIAKFEYEEIDYDNRSRYIPLRAMDLPDNIDTDVLYVTGGYYFFLKQSLKFQLPKVYGFHDPALQNPNNYFQKRIIKKLLPKFEVIHLLNSSQSNIVKIPQKSVLLENTWFDNVPPKETKLRKFTIVFFGRHEKDKGVDTVKYIINNIPPDIVLIICGSGSMSDELRTERENVKYMGFVAEDELEKIISECHAVLFPSYSEASSLVALESLAHNTPLIYRDISQNEFLSNKPLCKKASSDIEFLDCVKTLKTYFYDKPEEYLSQCDKLFSTLMPKDEYINTFLHEIINVSINNFRRLIID